MQPPSPNALTAHLFALQDAVQAKVRAAVAAAGADELAGTARDGDGDTVFALDLAAEDVLLPFCEQLGASVAFRLVAEGLPPEGRCFGAGAPSLRLIVDPVDGTRGLMHDKRSAWCLAAFAEEHGGGTRLSHVVAAAMTELPTSRQAVAERLWATRGTVAQGSRTDLRSGATRSIAVQPSRSETLRHGFATVCDFFPGGKELLGRLADAILQEAMGGWNPGKAEVFSDQYPSSGGQLAELALGRDRFVLDVRPLVYRALGVESSLCCRPYDLCTALVAQPAGVVVTGPTGEPFDPPLDVVTNLAFAAYANPGLQARLQPIVGRALRACGLLE